MTAAQRPARDTYLHTNPLGSRSTGCRRHTR